MQRIACHPESLTQSPFHYCPGCGHSIAHRLIAEAVDTLGIREKVIGIAPVGCAVFAHRYFSFDMLEVAHGRPPAAATALKRLMPDRIVFSYQGDGDLAAIGTSEIIHAANRGERISVFFINNATFGMTGGQMAPTTLLGQKTTTTVQGRLLELHGRTLKVAELLSAIDTIAFLARGALHTPRHVMRSRALIQRSLSLQMEGAGFSFIELLSPCPTAWKMSPVDSVAWMNNVMMPYFKLGVIKDLWKRK
ncbi:MAG TPA: thiamine pyrophosphate-dependent enzyme [Dissulfurispiraceae bacterium]|nr:thiamine pyrophosphate-dependent enzyme [Dissulfurispiraceae bacterium]